MINSRHLIAIFLMPLIYSLGIRVAPIRAATETVTIDLAGDQGAITHRASGFIHALDQNTPPTALVEPLKAQLFRFGWSFTNEAYVRAKSLGAQVQVVLSDLMGYGSVPDPVAWQNLVTTQVTLAKANNQQIQWDL
jgi:hypothetical protein